MSNPTIDDSQLLYDAAAEILTVNIGEKGPQTITAYSGGSRGHKTSVTPAQAKAFLHDKAKYLSTYLSTTAEKKDAQGNYKRRGGTLPGGHYTCAYVHHHPTLGECVRLTGDADTKSINSPFASMPIPVGFRSGFYIHGSGPKGSDGCIVVMKKAELRYICDTVKGATGQVKLFVNHVGYELPAEKFSPGERQVIV